MANNFTNNDTEIDNAILSELLKDSPKGGSSLYGQQDMTKLVNTFLEEDMPDDLKQSQMVRDFWAVLGKTIKLSFMEKDDIEDFETLFEIARIDYVMSIPEYEYTFKDAKHLEQLRIYFLAACKRAMGSPSHKFNERIILGGSISQVIRSNTEAIKTGDGGSRGGLFSKLRGMF